LKKGGLRDMATHKTHKTNKNDNRFKFNIMIGKVSSNLPLEKCIPLIRGKINIKKNSVKPCIPSFAELILGRRHGINA
jgi:hypothetical protein